MRFMSNPPLAEEDQTGRIVTGQSTPHCSGNPDDPMLKPWKTPGVADWVEARLTGSSRQLSQSYKHSSWQSSRNETTQEAEDVYPDRFRHLYQFLLPRTCPEDVIIVGMSSWKWVGRGEVFHRDRQQTTRPNYAYTDGLSTKDDSGFGLTGGFGGGGVGGAEGLREEGEAITTERNGAA